MEKKKKIDLKRASTVIGQMPKRPDAMKDQYHKRLELKRLKPEKVRTKKSQKQIILEPKKVRTKKGQNQKGQNQKRQNR